HAPDTGHYAAGDPKILPSSFHLAHRLSPVKRTSAEFYKKPEQTRQHDDTEPYGRHGQDGPYHRQYHAAAYESQPCGQIRHKGHHPRKEEDDTHNGHHDSRQGKGKKH